MGNSRTASKVEALPVQLAEPKPISPDAFNARLATGGAFSATMVVNSFLGLTSDPSVMLATVPPARTVPMLANESSFTRVLGAQGQTTNCGRAKALKAV